MDRGESLLGQQNNANQASVLNAQLMVNYYIEYD